MSVFNVVDPVSQVIGTLDTIAYVSAARPGQLTSTISIDLNDDPNFTGTGQLSFYLVEFKDGKTGEFLSGGEIDQSTFYPSLNYYGYDPEFRNQIISVENILNPSGPNYIYAAPIFFY